MDNERQAADTDLFLGIDFGSSGCRAAALDTRGTLVALQSVPLPPAVRIAGAVTQEPWDWWRALGECLRRLFARIDSGRVRRLAADGTSGTLVVCDSRGTPLAPALMYDDRRPRTQAGRIALYADASSGAHGAGGSLAKLLWLQDHGLPAGAAHAVHQADWIANRLSGRYGHSDYNNSLKLGYDVHALRWPAWMAELGVPAHLLPEVHAPGESIGTVDAAVAAELGLPPDVVVAAGTTDGVAAFLAAGATEPGDGVTSLGSTLALKLLAKRPVFSTRHGVYSHRLGHVWLAGGASNAGGATLLQLFDARQLRALEARLDPDRPSGLDYYPLPARGERFPVCDPDLPSRLEPRPEDPALFYQGLLEGMARIEADGYRCLAALGAGGLRRLRTTGGGARNPAWARIRERTLGVALQQAHFEEAACGAALLAAGLAKPFCALSPKEG